MDAPASSSSAPASYTPHDPATTAREVRENPKFDSRAMGLPGWGSFDGHPWPWPPINVLWRQMADLHGLGVR
jgi:hypothetical protein